jgi:hypothetical protein
MISKRSSTRSLKFSTTISNKRASRFSKVSTEKEKIFSKTFVLSLIGNL